MPFKKGVKIAGRAKGTPNKITADIKDMIRGALDEAGGQKYLVAQAQTNPAAFLALVAKIVPKEIVGELAITRVEVVHAIDAPGTLKRVEAVVSDGG